jgi:photosystem II stability/assembly factor-like uncharacterized protein
MYLEARVWTFSSHRSNPESIYAGTDMGLFRWDEGPARWTHLPSPMQDVWAIAQDPDKPEVLLAGTRPAAFFRSRDGGRSWEPLPVPGIAKFSSVNMGPTRVTQFWFDPHARDVVWATVEIGGIYRSDDRGATWTLCDDGLISTDVHGIVTLLDAQGRHLALALTNRGLHRSSDRGASWQYQELPTPWQYTRSICVPAGAPDTVLITNGNGPPGNSGRLLRSDDHGTTFSQVPLPCELNSTLWCIALHPDDPRRMFMGTNLGQIFRSADGGGSWERLPHEFGELRALHWRPLPPGTRREPHSLTRATVRIPNT